MGKITVVGSLNMDLVVMTDSIPRTGETVMGEELSYSCGGKGGNQAYAAARMGADVAMIGCVGTDEFGKTLKQSLKQVGIDTAGVQEIAGASSGAAVITVKEGDNSIIVIPGANAAVTTSYVQTQTALLAAAELILLQLEIPLEAVEFVTRYGRENHIAVMLNPAPAQVLSDEILNNLTYFIVNETESEYYTGIKITDQRDMKRSIRQLKDLGVTNPVITLGSRGVVLEEKGEFIHIPARKVTAVDTTAAGDTFAAALSARLTEGDSLSAAAQFATVASSIAVTRKGAQSSIPTLAEVEALLDTYTNGLTDGYLYHIIDK